jgi:hypothetical protein
MCKTRSLEPVCLLMKYRCAIKRVDFWRDDRFLIYMER